MGEFWLISECKVTKKKSIVWFFTLKKLPYP